MTERHEIDTVWALVWKADPGTGQGEGLCSAPALPIICFDPGQVDHLRRLGRGLARQLGRPVQLVRFGECETLETFGELQ